MGTRSPLRPERMLLPLGAPRDPHHRTPAASSLLLGKQLPPMGIISIQLLRKAQIQLSPGRSGGERLSLSSGAPLPPHPSGGRFGGAQPLQSAILAQLGRTDCRLLTYIISVPCL